jgi:hypothetical protein
MIRNEGHTEFGRNRIQDIAHSRSIAMLWAIVSSVFVIYLYRTLNATANAETAGAAVPANGIDTELAKPNSRIDAMQAWQAAKRGDDIVVSRREVCLRGDMADISIFDCCLRAQTEALARGHYPEGADWECRW